MIANLVFGLLLRVRVPTSSYLAAAVLFQITLDLCATDSVRDKVCFRRVFGGHEPS